MTILGRGHIATSELRVAEVGMRLGGLSTSSIIGSHVCEVGSLRLYSHGEAILRDKLVHHQRLSFRHSFFFPPQMTYLV